MKKRRLLRALSLAAALALALTAAGLAEAAIEPAPEEVDMTSEIVEADDIAFEIMEEDGIAAEAVDEVVESGELELGDDADPSASDADEAPDGADISSDPLSDADMIPESEPVPAEDTAVSADAVVDAPDLPDESQETVAEDQPSPEAPAEPSDDAKRTPPALSNAEMADNIRDAALGSKADALGNIAELLMDRGFEPAFAAGVCANIYSEGSYGLFERSGYESSPDHPDLAYIRPRYFCYLDGGNYYTRGEGGYAVTDVYLSPDDTDAYTGGARVHMRYGDENYYLDNWSGRRVWETDLNALEEFMVQLASLRLQYGTPDAWTYDRTTDSWEYNEAQEGMETWRGKFGLGCAQWTGEESMKLLAFYRKHAGAGSATITREQVIAAEHEMILSDLRGRYNKVYTGWKQENEGALYCPEAAASAGSWVCLKYEIPANRESEAVRRGRKAAEIYRIMISEN